MCEYKNICVTSADNVSGQAKNVAEQHEFLSLMDVSTGINLQNRQLK